jgi:hypothetical protein
MNVPSSVDYAVSVGISTHTDCLLLRNLNRPCVHSKRRARQVPECGPGIVLVILS